MNQKFTALLRQRTRLFGLLVCVLGVSLLAMSAIGFWNDQHASDQNRAPRTAAATIENPASQQAPSAQQVESQSTSVQGTQPIVSQKTKQPQPKPTQPAAATSTTPACGDQAPAPTESATIQVALKVNDKCKGSVTLPKNSDQCDVLQHALDDGIISSLSMKFNEALKSYGVYVIDGIGDSKSMGWTYKVNDKFVLGCSLVTAQNGDVISWKYVN